METNTDQYAGAIVLIILIAILRMVARRSQSPGQRSRVQVVTSLTNRDGETITKSMLIDPSAQSTNPSEPAFLAPPPDSKVYYGFPLIDEISIDGFALGSITDYLEPDSAEGCTMGDAFVEAPDGTRAGIFWEVSDELILDVLEEPGEGRWGVYYFTVPRPVNSIEDLKYNFSVMLPTIKELYERAHQH